MEDFCFFQSGLYVGIWNSWWVSWTRQLKWNLDTGVNMSPFWVWILFNCRQDWRENIHLHIFVSKKRDIIEFFFTSRFTPGSRKSCTWFLPGLLTAHKDLLQVSLQLCDPKQLHVYMHLELVFWVGAIKWSQIQTSQCWEDKSLSQGKEECEEMILQPSALPAPADLEAHGALQNSKLAWTVPWSKPVSWRQRKTE